MKEQMTFDYSALDAGTRGFVQERAAQIHALAKMTANAIKLIGQYLTEVKERLKHGEFLNWLKDEFDWSQPTAWRFMNVYQQFKLSNLNNLEIDVSALYLIAAPKTPEPIRTEVIRRVDAGETVTHRAVREAIHRFEETGELPNVERTLEQIVRERKTLRTRDEEPVAPLEVEREIEAIQARIKMSEAQVMKLMVVIRAIEVLNRPPLSVAEVAREIQRMDTPDKDWVGQVRNAGKRIAELIKELKQ